MPRGKERDPLKRKWEWAKIQWEVAKETGVVDDSRRQLILPVTAGKEEPSGHPMEKDHPGKAH